MVNCSESWVSDICVDDFVIDAGKHTVRIDRKSNTGHTLAAGPYLCRMNAGSFSKTVTIIVR